MSPLPIYIISLKRTPERRLYMQRQLDALNLNINLWKPLTNMTCILLEIENYVGEDNGIYTRARQTTANHDFHEK